MRSLSILGSTGSIGKNCLETVRHIGASKAKVVALATRNNIAILEEQIQEFQPEFVAVYDREQAVKLQKKLPHLKIASGMEGIEAAACFSKSNLVVAAISGLIGLFPTLAAINAGKNVGFATKEVLVSAGELVMPLVKEKGIQFIPIDSELTSIFQCLKNEPAKTVRKIYITASGGPFRNFSKEECENATVEQALNHPNYRMGPKVTIDSSTLMNKGLEMIEAHRLFNLPVDKIEIVVHPQQIIHGMVEYIDNSILAFCGEPDMRIPIQYAITYPERLQGQLPPFDFIKNPEWRFFLPDIQRFRCLKLAYESARQGKSYPCYMNGVNEVLVHRFLNREIKWRQIGEILEDLLAKHKPLPIRSLEDVLAVDQLAREEANNMCLCIPK
jgi:1-deoxy-D-xylulose-5-phosphate reductoisomerase